MAISSILIRSSRCLNQVILKINPLLKMLCVTNGFNFTSSDEIGRQTVSKDGLHLAYDEKAMLANNLQNI